jgi:transposase
MEKANFSDEFKRDAVAQITERGYPVAEVSQRLRVSPHSLHGWKRQLAVVLSVDASKDAQIRQLKRELARVTEERDILKRPTRISLEMQSKVRVHCRASRSVWRASHVPVPRCATQ